MICVLAPRFPIQKDRSQDSRSFLVSFSTDNRQGHELDLDRGSAGRRSHNFQPPPPSPSITRVEQALRYNPADLGLTKIHEQISCPPGSADFSGGLNPTHHPMVAVLDKPSQIIPARDPSHHLIRPCGASPSNTPALEF